jgi:hypothetical protein
VLAFPHKQAAQDLAHHLDAFVDHDTTGRLPQVTAPALVLAGSLDLVGRPDLARRVAELIPGAAFEVQEGEAHQPFHEVLDVWNTRIDAFWQDVEARPSTPPRPRTAHEAERSTSADRRVPWTSTRLRSRSATQPCTGSRRPATTRERLRRFLQGRVLLGDAVSSFDLSAACHTGTPHTNAACAVPGVREFAPDPARSRRRLPRDRPSPSFVSSTTTRSCCR